MKTFDISTALSLFKKLLITMERSNKTEYIDTVNDIQNNLLKDNFEKSLTLLDTLKFSFYENEDKVEKELLIIIKKKILSAYVYHLEETIIDINKMALSLLPCDFVINDIFFPSGLVKKDIDFETLIKKIDGETFKFKDTIVYLLKSSLFQQRKAITISKQLAES